MINGQPAGRAVHTGKVPVNDAKISIWPGKKYVLGYYGDLSKRTVTLNLSAKNVSKETIPVIDLLAGPGGLGEGFSANEQALKAELGGEKWPPKRIDQYIMKALNGETNFVLVGSPPFQAFTRVARATLREVMPHPGVFLHDRRSGLYRDCIRFFEELASLAVMVENVPDVLNYGELKVFEAIAGALEDLRYEHCCGLLNASHYGGSRCRGARQWQRAA